MPSKGNSRLALACGLILFAYGPAGAMGFNPTQTVLKTQCPVLKQYDAETIKKLGKELRGAPSDATWPGMIVDYRTLRLMCQAIENK